MATFNILMFGSRRTGKSSILASMIDSFEKINESTQNKIKLEATEDTKPLLKKKKMHLSEIFDKHKDCGGQPFYIDENLNDNSYEYEFKITADGSEDSHMIVFKDIPGEWLMTEAKKKELDSDVAKSQIIIIAIDTPHLMEENGDFNNSFNVTSQVSNFLNNPKDNKDIPRMILFVPIKCEKYYHEGRMDEVNSEIKKQYNLLFKNFATPPKKELYTVAITPILTLGGIVFHDFERDSDGDVLIINNPNIPSLAYRPQMTYYRFYDKAPFFAPKYCEQPVLYLLKFILKIEGMTTVEECDRDRSLFDLIFETVGTILGSAFAILFRDFKWLAEMWTDLFRDKELIKRAVTLSESIKVENDGYEIIQNPF